MNPNSNRMLEIAALLYEYYGERTELMIRAGHLETDAGAMRLALTPIDGWPGKNAEARELAQKQAERAAGPLQECLSDLDGLKEEIARLDAEVAGVEAERRALEWQTRARLVEALERKFIQPNGRGERAESSFDDAGQAELDEMAYEQAAAYAAGTRAAAADDDDIPF